MNQCLATQEMKDWRWEQWRLDESLEADLEMMIIIGRFKHIKWDSYDINGVFMVKKRTLCFSDMKQG